MNIVEIDRLSRQSQHKSQTISRLMNEINCLKNDLQTQKQVISRMQSQKQQFVKEIQTLKNIIQQQRFEQQNTENRYFLVLQKLQEQVQQGKKKFHKLNNKIAPLIDHDTVRLSVMNQLSQQHQLEIQKYKHQIEMQKDQIHKLTRQKTLLQHKLNTNKIQYEENIRQLNNTMRSQTSQNQLTALSLQMSKEIQNRLKLSYQTIKKQAEYYKDKYFTVERKYQQKVTHLERQLKDLKNDLS